LNLFNNFINPEPTLTHQGEARTNYQLGFVTSIPGQNVNKPMSRIEQFYATNQRRRMDPTTPDLPSIYLPVGELSDE